jgi:hypothetical protein
MFVKCLNVIKIIKIYVHLVFVLQVSAAYGHLQATHLLKESTALCTWSNSIHKGTSSLFIITFFEFWCCKMILVLSYILRLFSCPTGCAVCLVASSVAYLYINWTVPTSPLVNSRLPTAAAWVQSQIRSCSVCCGQNGDGAGLFWVLRLSFHLLLHIH